jgi:hypothetical protein
MGDVIKSFMVGLGFGVDEKSLATFNKAIESASLRVAALYGSIQVAAAGIFASIAGVSKGFEDMGYQLRIVAPAMNRWLVMRQAMIEAYTKAGVDISATVKSAILFNYSLAKTKFALEAVYKSVAAKFFPILTKQMDLFRSKIYANMPKIQAQLKKFVDFIFKAFDATVELGTRLYSILTRVWDFFARLDEATNGWSTIILGVVAAWKLLNLSFLATPLGAILAGLVSLLALFDDFKVWQEGGKSLFDWGPFVPVINAVSAAVSAFKDVLGSVFMILFDVFGLLKDLFTLNFSEFTEDLKNGLSDIGTYVNNLVSYYTKLSGIVSAIGSWAPSAVGWVSNHLGGGGGNQAASAPLLPPGAGGNQNVNQQTHITVNGAADANSVGKTVVNQQDRVNFDMTRNLKGAMQ